MRRLPFFSVLLSVLFCLSCAKPQAEYRPTTTIKDLMDSIVDPAADTIWGSVAIINGKEAKAPHTDAERGTVRHGAIQLLEASNLLQIPGRHVAMPGQKNEQGLELQPEQIETLINQDRQAWITLAHGLTLRRFLRADRTLTNPVNIAISNTAIRAHPSPTVNSPQALERGEYFLPEQSSFGEAQLRFVHIRPFTLNPASG